MHFPGLLAPDSLGWRWEAVTEAAGYNEHAAALIFKDLHDPLLLRAFKLKAKMDEAEIAAGRNWHRLIPKADLPLAAAYHIYVDRPKIRWFIEGMLLAGVTPEEFVSKYNYGQTASVDVIEAYRDLFFDVRDRLDQHGWIVECLFNGSLYSGISRRDTAAVMHRVAWLGGPEVFTSFYTRRPDPRLRTNLVELMRDMMHRQSVITSMCLVHTPETELQSIKTLLDDTYKLVGDTVADATTAETAKAVKSFLSGLSMEVADATAEANLTLPAREPRVADFQESASVLQAHV